MKRLSNWLQKRREQQEEKQRELHQQRVDLVFAMAKEGLVARGMDPDVVDEHIDSTLKRIRAHGKEE